MRTILKWAPLFLMAVLSGACGSTLMPPPQVAPQVVRYEIAANAKGEVVAVRFVLPDGDTCVCGDPTIPEKAFRTERTYSAIREKTVEAILATEVACTLFWDSRACQMISSIGPIYNDGS